MARIIGRIYFCSVGRGSRGYQREPSFDENLLLTVRVYILPLTDDSMSMDSA